MEDIFDLIELIEYNVEDSNASTTQINNIIDDIQDLKKLLTDKFNIK